MHLFTISREDATFLIEIVNKMVIKYLLIICVVLVGVNCECGDYLSCLRDLIHNFFGTSSTAMMKENTTDLHEVKKFNNSDFDKILSDVSSLVNDEIAGDISVPKSQTARYNSNKTNILIKVFDFGYPKGFEKVADTTETPEIFVTLKPTTEKNLPKEIYLNPLTVDGITKVNNMADSLENFKQNLILSSDGIDAYEDLDEKNGTDVNYPNIDYIELYKDSTIEYLDFVPTELPIVSDDIAHTEGDVDNSIEYSFKVEKKSPNSLDDHVKGSCQGNLSEVVFPWIVAIFIKNDSMENQFEYYCDGALLSDRFILTAAQCVHIANGEVDPENILVVPGKGSLHTVGDNEKAYRVERIQTHDNFTLEDDIAENDLTLLEIEELVVFSERIQPAYLVKNDSFAGRDAATTGWELTGELNSICFNKESSCKTQTENTFCATYSYNIATCPSYGGLHVAKHADTWHLHGIRTGDPAVRGICIERDVSYTDLRPYTDWIENIINDY